MTRDRFQEMTDRGIVLMDGATGSVLRTRGLPVGVCSEEWILNNPEHLLHLQSDYAEAGSNIVYAPTFTANRIGLAMYGKEALLDEYNRGLVALSKQAVAGRALVAGDMTTTGRVLEPAGEMTYTELFDVYREQAEVLVAAGVDLIGAETMLNLEETTVLLDAVQSVCDLPVTCTLTIQSDGSLMYGGTITESVETLEALGASAVGLNCSVGPDQLETAVRMMRDATSLPLIVKPNAGIPTMDRFGNAHYSMKAEEFADHMERLVALGVNIIGGCCGTDPKYIRALHDRFCRG